MEIKERIINVVKDNMVNNTSMEISGKDYFIQDLSFDSIKLMGLFYSIEEEFEISIFDNEENYRFFAIETIDDLVSLISGAVIS